MRGCEKHTVCATIDGLTDSGRLWTAIIAKFEAMEGAGCPAAMEALEEKVEIMLVISALLPLEARFHPKASEDAPGAAKSVDTPNGASDDVKAQHGHVSGCGAAIDGEPRKPGERVH